MFTCELLILIGMCCGLRSPPINTNNFIFKSGASAVRLNEHCLHLQRLILVHLWVLTQWLQVCCVPTFSLHYSYSAPSVVLLGEKSE